MNTFTMRTRPYAPTVLRIGLSLVFFWFSWQQFAHPPQWIRLVPAWVVATSHLTSTTLVYINASFEAVMGVLLFLGLFLPVTTLLLALHMLDIAYTVGYGAIGVRDFGLSIGMISLFMYGVSPFSLDAYFAKSKSQGANISVE